MRDDPAHRWQSRRRDAVVGLLGVELAGLGVGALLHLAGRSDAGDAAWTAAGALGAAFALWSLLEDLRRGRAGLDVIALVALVAALAVGESLAATVVAVMLVGGRALEAWAAGRARRDLQALVRRSPERARRRTDGEVTTVPLDEVARGDVLVVAGGEVVPVDGILLTGPATLDESALTGEPLPVQRPVGDAVASGVVNAGSAVELRAAAAARDSTYAAIVRLVSEAEQRRARFVRLADRVALWFLGVTAIVTAIAWAVGGTARAVTVLVVATPCPLILAAPVAFVSGLSRTSRMGVVVKGGDVLERLARCRTAVLDKTGTVTAGRPEVARVVGHGSTDPDRVLADAASLEQISPHPVATAIVRAGRDRGCALALPADVEEAPGQGVRGWLGERAVSVGSARWTGVDASRPWIRAVRRRAALEGSMTAFVAVDGGPAGAIVLRDPIRPDAARTLRSMRAAGIDRIVLLTGDHADVAESVGTLVGVDSVLPERSPAGKVDAVRAEQGTAPTMMVGDGINDAPSLAVADVGVAIGARGSSASSEAADVVLVVDHLDRVAAAKVVAVRTRAIALQSVVAGMALSLAAMFVALAGLLPAVWGALLQEAIDVAVILNAMRVLAVSPPAVRVEGAAAELSDRFRAEHQAIRADLELVRRAADALGPGGGNSAEAMAQVREVHRLLVTEVAPHEAAEESDLYPAIGRALGGADPTGTMSRGHAEIAHQIRRLGRILEELGDRAPDDVELAELRGLLYGLHAVLELHTTQEEESYLSLGGPDS